ncbi:hypothetical protein CEXT_254161 [Caerostris extrusa]|uniref:Uncharacterized protein n=1 Tax=Caerostris extrusa TaxID=172846 RepID=A0AAV4X131_CAEEX|nr:hypothetical protein CEXT_254161 [Caerostris extrusa]
MYITLLPKSICISSLETTGKFLTKRAFHGTVLLREVCSMHRSPMRLRNLIRHHAILFSQSDRLIRAQEIHSNLISANIKAINGNAIGYLETKREGGFSLFS